MNTEALRHPLPFRFEAAAASDPGKAENFKAASKLCGFSCYTKYGHSYYLTRFRKRIKKLRFAVFQIYVIY
jgi:hypothetical protein